MTHRLLPGFFALFVCLSLNPMAQSSDAITSTAIPANVTPSNSFRAQVSGIDLVKKKPLTIQLDQAKRGTIIVFLSIKCPCSNSYVPILEELAEKYQEAKEFQFVGIHSNFDEDTTKSFEYFASKKLTFPVLQDEGMRLADFYKAFKTPHAFIVSPKGEILFRGGMGSQNIYQAGKTKNFLANALKSLHEEKEIEEKDVRTLGCIIKRPEDGAGSE